MSDMESFIAENRFGLGVRNFATQVRDDPKRWLLKQIQPGVPTPSALKRFPGSAEILAAIHTARLSGAKDLKKAARVQYRRAFRNEVAARTQWAVRTDTPLAERMVWFWSNHFTVSQTKAISGPAIPAYEREAVRPHVFGQFEDLLLACVGHPCMLSYLDNTVSVGPNSKVGRRGKRSLNENLAREILELHTLGVNGGYTQTDITELAKALTGWTHGGMLPKRMASKVTGDFVFRHIMHEPGSKTILGRVYPSAGRDEGIAILKDLAKHPSTARFIATKLARHFVADEPSASVIDEIAHVFVKTDGNLAEVTRTLVHLDEVWRVPLPKVKTPHELVVSTFRATNSDQMSAKLAMKALNTLGQTPFSAPSPQGWSDRASHWLAPEALMRRIEWVRAVAAQLSPRQGPQAILESLIGPVATAETRKMVARAPTADAGLALILASAEFQRR